MQRTAIEWTDYTWNPTTGCSPISPGCQHCWAARMAKRLAGRAGYHRELPFLPTFHRGRLDEPKHHRKPARIAVSLMGDLFHNAIARDEQEAVMATITATPWHTYQILTKRSSAAREFFGRYYANTAPPQNLWVGASAEDATTLIYRARHLIDTPAAKRFLSLEPLLGPVRLDPYLEQIDWVIAGGESGPGARPANPDWFKEIRDACERANVPFFFKGWGDWAPSATFAYYSDGMKLGGDCGGPGSIAYHTKPPTVTLRNGAERRCNVESPADHTWGRDNGLVMTYCRLGKAIAGRLLDGREHLDLPTPLTNGAP